MEYFDDPFYIGVEETKEHEDGAATYTLTMNDHAKTEMAKIGLEFVLRCAAYNLDLQDALDNVRKMKDA